MEGNFSHSASFPNCTAPPPHRISPLGSVLPAAREAVILHFSSSPGGEHAARRLLSRSHHRRQNHRGVHLYTAAKPPGPQTATNSPLHRRTGPAYAHAVRKTLSRPHCTDRSGARKAMTCDRKRKSARRLVARSRYGTKQAAPRPSAAHTVQRTPAGGCPPQFCRAVCGFSSKIRRIFPALSDQTAEKEQTLFPAISSPADTPPESVLAFSDNRNIPPCPRATSRPAPPPRYPPRRLPARADMRAAPASRVRAP